MERLGLGAEELTARFPRLIYASISGYGATGPWVDRRAYASVIAAEAGITKLQGDARGGDYANDPLSHADTYTGMELTIAILAALYQRERDGRRAVDRRLDGRDDAVRQRPPQRRAVGRPRGPAGDPQLRPRRLHRVRARRRRPRHRQRAPGRARHVHACSSRRSTSEHVADDPRFVDVASRKEHAAELREILARGGGARSPTGRRSRRICDRNKLAVGRLRSGRDLADSDWARERGAIAEVSDRGGGTIRIPNPPWHFSARRGRRCRAAPSTAARTTAPCSPTCSATTTPRSTPSRPTGCCRAGCHHRSRMTPVVPGGADEGDARDAAHRGRRLGVRGQVGRLPHARVRRRRAGAAAELEPPRRHGASTRRCRRWPTSVGGQRAILDGELVVLDDARPAAVRADPAQGDRPPGGRLLRVRRARRSTATTRSACRTRSAAGCCASCSTTAPTGRSRRTASATARRCSTATEAQELEGVMAKRLGTTYRPGARSKDWRKVKHRRRAEVVIGGYTPGTGNRSNTFGSLLVGRWDGDRLAFAGGVGTGLQPAPAGGAEGPLRRAAHRRLPVRPAAADGLPPRRGVGRAGARGARRAHRVHERGLRPPVQLHRPDRAVVTPRLPHPSTGRRASTPCGSGPRPYRLVLGWDAAVVTIERAAAEALDAADPLAAGGTAS